MGERKWRSIFIIITLSFLLNNNKVCFTKKLPEAEKCFFFFSMYVYTCVLRSDNLLRLSTRWMDKRRAVSY